MSFTFLFTTRFLISRSYLSFHRCSTLLPSVFSDLIRLLLDWPASIRRRRLCSRKQLGSNAHKFHETCACWAACCCLRQPVLTTTSARRRGGGLFRQRKWRGGSFQQNWRRLVLSSQQLPVRLVSWRLPSIGGNFWYNNRIGGRGETETWSSTTTVRL